MKKKGIIIAVIIVSIILIASIVCGIILVPKLIGGDQVSNGTIKTKGEQYKVTEDESKTVEYDTFDNGLVSFEYPKGWKVDVAGVDYIHYSFIVYNPENPLYMFSFTLKHEGFLKSELARETYAKLYPDNPFSKLPAIDPATTESYFKVWNQTAKYCNENDVKRDYYPMYNDWSIIENLGKAFSDGDLLRASFTNDEGKKGEGLFTASVMSAGTYMINKNPYDIFSNDKVDVWPYNVYNIVTMTAPEGEFTNWHPVLEKCFNTIQFSSAFMSGFNSEETTLVNTITANQKVYDSISDMIVSSYEARNKSYDIISQKQSDATMGYEGVYDVETGDIYKADLGFTDSYTGDRYQAITDDMYTKATSGYIEKVTP